MLALEKKIEFSNNLLIKSTLNVITHQEAHFHENAVEIIFVLDGTIRLRSSHRHVTLHKGDVFSVDPGDIHCIYSDTKNLVLSIHINIINNVYSIEKMHNCFFACETLSMQDYQKTAMYLVKDLMLAISLENTINNTAFPTEISKIGDMLLEVLVQHFDWLSFMWDPTDSNPLLQERFYRIISYCQDNYKEKISVAMLAKKEHFNENYFSSLMKKTSFEGFGNMLNFFRCDGAERMLLTTDESVVDISNICGFSDPKYFYKHFKKWWNLSPAKLRNWYKDYSQEEPNIYTLSTSESFDALKEYLAEHHIKRIFLV